MSRGRPETWPRPRPRFVPPPAPVPAERLAGVGRILLIRLRALGDVVLATPAARALRRQFPSAEIVMMADAAFAPALEGIEGPDEILAHPRRLRARGLRGLVESRDFASSLRGRRFDLVIDLFGNPRSALLTAISGAPLRLGYDVRGRRVSYNIRQPRHVLTGGKAVLKYAALVNLDMLKRLGPVDADGEDHRPRLVATLAEREAARGRLAATGASRLAAGERLVGLLPAGSWSAKTWPADRFARLGDLLVERARAKVVLLWGPGEEALAREVAARMRAPAAIAPDLALRSLMGTLAELDLLVGNDSGPQHLARALGTPTIALHGPTDPATWFPGEGPHRAVSLPVPCGPCDRTGCPDLRCLLAITPERVLCEALPLLESGR